MSGEELLLVLLAPLELAAEVPVEEVVCPSTTIEDMGVAEPSVAPEPPESRRLLARVTETSSPDPSLFLARPEE